EKFSAYLKTLSTQIISNRELLNNKIKEPSRSIDLISVREQLGNIREIIQGANEEIKKHNHIVANYSAEKKELINDVWRYLSDEYKAHIEPFMTKSDGLQKGIDSLERQRLDLQQKYRAKDAEIKQANKNVTSVQPSEIGRASCRERGYIEWR